MKSHGKRQRKHGEERHRGNYIMEVQPGNEGNVVLSNGARAPEIKLDAKQLTVTGHQGYRMVRSTHGMYAGTYYYEATVLEPDDMSEEEYRTYPAIDLPHYRLGIARRRVCLFGPVGYDRHGFGIRDFDGTLLLSRNRIKNPFMRPYGIGSVVGVLIHIPPCESCEPWQEVEYLYTKYGENRTGCEKPIYDTDNIDGDNDTLEETRDPTGTIMLKRKGCSEVVIKGSYIRFFVDGHYAGSFTDIPFDRYYPALSVYGKGKVKANFGALNKIREDCKFVGNSGVFNPVYLESPSDISQYNFRYYPTEEHVRDDYIPQELSVVYKIPKSQKDESLLRYDDIVLPDRLKDFKPAPLVPTNPYKSVQELKRVFLPFNELYAVRLASDFESTKISDYEQEAREKEEMNAAANDIVSEDETMGNNNNNNNNVPEVSEDMTS